MLASDYRAQARDALRGRWGLSIGLTLLAGILGATVGAGGNFSSIIDIALDAPGLEFVRDSFIANAVLVMIVGVAAISTIFGIVTTIIGGAIQLGLSMYNIRLIRKEEQGIGTLFEYFFIFGKAFGLRIVTGIFTFLWSLLLVIPGIVASYRYAMAPYIMASNPEIGVMEAIRLSKEMMNGRKWDLFVLHLSFIGWSILSMFTLGIGSLWLNPYVCAAEAAFFLNASQNGLGYYGTAPMGSPYYGQPPAGGQPPFTPQPPMDGMAGGQPPFAPQPPMDGMAGGQPPFTPQPPMDGMAGGQPPFAPQPPMDGMAGGQPPFAPQPQQQAPVVEQPIAQPYYAPQAPEAAPVQDTAASFDMPAAPAAPEPPTVENIDKNAEN